MEGHHWGSQTIAAQLKFAKSVWTLHNTTGRTLCGRMNLMWSCKKGVSHCPENIFPTVKYRRERSLPRRLIRKYHSVSPPADTHYRLDYATAQWDGTLKKIYVRVVPQPFGGTQSKPTTQLCVEMLWMDVNRAIHSSFVRRNGPDVPLICSSDWRHLIDVTDAKARY